MKVDIERELAELEQKEAEAIRAEEEARKIREAIMEAKKLALEKKEKEDKHLEDLAKVFSTPDNIILGANKGSRFLIGATREYYKIDTSLTNEVILEVLRGRLESVKLSANKNKSVKDDVEAILKEEEVKLYGNNPLETLSGFKFRLANQASCKPWSRYRQTTSSPSFGYVLRDDKIIKMDTSDRRDETHEFFNRWTLWDILYGVGEFDAIDQTTGEPFRDTLTTLNPNVVQLELKNGKVVSLAPYKQSRVNLAVLESDVVDTAPYMTVIQYFSSLLICLREYFGSVFELNFARAFKKYCNATAPEGDTDNGYLIYKAFEEGSYHRYKAYVSKSSTGRFIYPSSRLKNLKKSAVHAYIVYVLKSLVPEKDAEMFCKAVKFYGVFDDIAQGDYETHKVNYFHTF